MAKIDGEYDKELRGAFFNMAYSPFVILNKDLNFVDINQAALNTIKIKREDFIGRNLLDFFPYLKENERYQLYKNVLVTGKSIGLDEVSFHTDDGVLKFMIKAFKIGDYLGMSTLDVTNLTNTIDQLKTTKVNLQTVNDNLKRKNQELEEFSYVAAHDLRSPLTNIHSLLDMLQSDNSISEKGMPVFEKVQQVAKQMCDKLRALNSVIALKTTLDDKIEIINFSAIVSKVKSIHIEEIVQTRTIIKEDFVHAPTIDYNLKQMESILQNLISNAIKYRNPNRKSVIFIKTSLVQGKLVLTVKDNGLGFDKTTPPEKIFGLFKRMHTHVEGLGVGLYVTHSMITNNGGEISVKSELNKGTEFKIIF
ncbi:PAS domain-containing sensor histidine kinase [Cellulophaga sp. Z1A5H]|uniref:PAS domain-containing sensor histidine kinase n=1 Tax=Cellulophaga sp. Z1A5H TaxID=2687291 RepID=UPI0013FDD94E|nr:PAS domain-containing sensor histidine kinase [Cellulophaga sp. Z1A5H]